MADEFKTQLPSGDWETYNLPWIELEARPIPNSSTRRPFFPARSPARLPERLLRQPAPFLGGLGTNFFVFLFRFPSTKSLSFHRCVSDI